MAHLRKSASGHLMKTASGHLAKGCPATCPPCPTSGPSYLCQVRLRGISLHGNCVDGVVITGNPNQDVCCRTDLGGFGTASTATLETTTYVEADCSGTPIETDPSYVQASVTFSAGVGLGWRVMADDTDSGGVFYDSGWLGGSSGDFEATFGSCESPAGPFNNSGPAADYGSGGTATVLHQVVP